MVESKICLKRSAGSTPPTTLEPGEPAWVEGAKTLFIGRVGGGIEPIAGEGVGYTVGQIIATASEAIAAGALVNFHGTGQIRNANAATGIAADGFVRTSIASGVQGIVHTLNGMTFSPIVEGGLALAGTSDYFLSAVTPGSVTVNRVAAGSNHIHQKIGKSAGTSLMFRPGDAVLRS